MVRKNWGKCDRLLNGENQVEVKRRDNITKEPSIIRLRKEQGSTLVTEEVREDGSVISQARITPDFRTDLTLQFKGSRYEQRNADPSITVDSRFPKASATVFNLLVNSMAKGLKHSRST